MTEMIRNAHAKMLCDKAGEDEAALSVELSDDIFGFHAQQSCEKLCKALLSSLAVIYPKTHNLELLKDLLDEASEPLPELPYDLLDLQPFAVDFRYDVGGRIREADKVLIRESVAALRKHVIVRILEIEAHSGE